MTSSEKENELERIYGEEFRPLYESGNYIEALRVYLKNWKIGKYSSIEEHEKMHEVFMKEFEPAAKILKMQSEGMIPFEKGFVPISKSNIKKIRKQINSIYARRN